MDFQDKFARIFCSFLSVFQVTNSQLSDLITEDMNVPEVIRIVGTNPVLKSHLGPFESVDDSMYKSMNYINGKRKMGFNRIGYRKRPETGKADISKGKIHNRKEELIEVNWDQAKLEQNDVQQQIKQLQTLLSNIKLEVSDIEKSLPDENLKKMPTGINIENNIKIFDPKGVKDMNNIIYNNRYLIGNVFIINRLSESSKETDVEVLKELTARKMKELLEKAVNNLTEDGIPAVTQPPQYEYEMDLLKQLQKNFSNMFNRQNVTLEHVNQMSKIIDFVERYHGAIMEVGSAEANRPGYGQMTSGRVESLEEVLYEGVDEGKTIRRSKGKYSRKAKKREKRNAKTKNVTKKIKRPV